MVGGLYGSYILRKLDYWTVYSWYYTNFLTYKNVATKRIEFAHHACIQHPPPSSTIIIIIIIIYETCQRKAQWIVASYLIS